VFRVTGVERRHPAGADLPPRSCDVLLVRPEDFASPTPMKPQSMADH
jgi:hypothetical protein